MRVAALAAALGLGAVLALVLSTVPRRGGSVGVPGLSRRVRIETDSFGIPTIRAATAEDASLALGYVHARDRLWQLEFQRRVAAGRLAEVLGPGAVPADRFLRTLGFRRAAAASLQTLSPAFRRRLAAYAAGVNAFLSTSRARPIELRLLRFEPAPFDEVDCLAWGKLMAWDLAGNAASEVRRARLTRIVGAARAAELFAPAPARPTILEEGEWKAPDLPKLPSGFPREPAPKSAVPPPPETALSGALAELLRLPAALTFGGEDVGSNSWVVAGSRTASGRPLLANDPHLGLRTPSVWYLARIEAAGRSVSGATLAGLPGVIIGRNARIAWGLTSLEPDVQDLYVERLDPSDPTRYRHGGRSVPFAVRRERIRVRGGPDVPLEVRESVHGPIVSDVLTGADSFGAPVALRWTGLDPGDRTPEAFAALETAADWSEFLAAVRLLHAPAQNFVYADADGHIGYTASGAIPIRPRGDGSVPVSGDGADDWTGFVPFDRLPRVLDPPRGFLVTANNRVAPAGLPYALSADWADPYRAQRITDLILSGGRLDVAAMRAIQLDSVSYQARELLPRLLVGTRPRDAASANALSLLAAWDGGMAPGSAPAAIYAAWFAALSRLAEDELGAEAGVARSRFVMNALSSDSAWCDDVRSTRRETCGDFAAAALARAVALVSGRLGADPRRWSWGRLHRARMPHAAFSSVPVLRRLFDLDAVHGGDRSTVDVGAYALDGSFTMKDGASYRQILDFARPGESLFVHTTGQSGNPFEPGYRDLLPLWRRGGYVRMDGPAREVLELVPAVPPSADRPSTDKASADKPSGRRGTPGG